MSVHDAEPGDIYTDESDKLWRIVGVCREPTVIAEEVEGTLRDPNKPPPLTSAAAVNMTNVGTFIRHAEIVKARKSGGMHGLMWTGWTRIWRRASQPAA